MGTFVNILKEFESGLNIAKKGITIAIGGPSGSGKTTVAEAIGKALNLKVINSGDIYRQLAKEQGVSLEEFSASHNDEVDYEIDRRNLAFAKTGGVVLVGRMCGWVAGDIADLKIYVDCDARKRAERVAKRDDKNVEIAFRDIVKRDISDYDTYKRLYNVIVKDVSIYDIIIDNGTMSYEESKIIPVEKAEEFLEKKGII